MISEAEVEKKEIEVHIKFPPKRVAYIRQNKGDSTKQRLSAWR